VVTLEAIRKADEALEGHIHRTPLEYSRTFSDLSGGDVYLKVENLQKTGSFKIRGALNKLLCLPEEVRTRGVIAASAGNHAQGVAYASRLLGVRATIVMPETAPISKMLATRGYGAEVILHGKDFDAAHRRALEIQGERDLTFIHAFDDPDVIAGQGTLGLEIHRSLPEVDQVVVPIGGGGLISGIAVALKTLSPSVRIVGVEAEGMAAMKASLEKGKIVPLPSGSTIAEGIAIKAPGELPFRLVREYVDKVVTVEEEEISSAILHLLERAKLLVEGAGAVSLAACLSRKVSCPGRKTVVLLSGGNIDTNLISWIIERGLIREGRYLDIHVVISDRFGALRDLLTVVAQHRANVISIRHDRVSPEVPIGHARVELLLETWGRDHSREILEGLRREGYPLSVSQGCLPEEGK
jgi:threonine dehydratase